MFNRKKLNLFIASAVVTSLIGFVPVEAKSLGIKNNNENKIHNKNNLDSSNKLTIMVYMDADNNLEEDLLNDIEEMKRGYVDNPNLNLIVLIDRAKNESNNSNILGENFTDTRMYKIEHNKAIRINGGHEFSEITTKSNYEANMGDAKTLKKFIKSCKVNYTADQYMLIMANHGGGARNKKLNKKFNKAICWDDSTYDEIADDSDCLYMGEISDVLTKKESVDILAFDACLMGTAEVAYQFRPNNGGFEAKYMVASAPVEWSKGYPYDEILNRLKDCNEKSNEEDLTLGAKEQYFNPSKVTEKQLGALIIEEQRDSVKKENAEDQQLSFYDLTKVKDVKNSLDYLAKNLSKENKKDEIEDLRGSNNNVYLMHYFNENDKYDWLDYPYFDLYDLCESINSSNNFSKETKELSKNVMQNLNDMVLYSFGGDKFKGFKEGKNGLSIFFPDGSREINDSFTGQSFTSWQAQRWYNSIDTTKELYLPYGKLSWCKDGQDPKVNKVGNWFELLDSWFDKANDKNGGCNHYQW